jgi:hypothetical protein
MTQLSEIPWDYIRRQITTVVADFIQPSSLLSSLRSAFADRQPVYAPEQCLIQGSPTATRRRLTLNPENKTTYTQKASKAPQEDPNVTPANNADKQQPVQNTVPTEQNIAAEKAAQATQQDVTLQPQMQNMQWQPRDTSSSTFLPLSNRLLKATLTNRPTFQFKLKVAAMVELGLQLATILLHIFPRLLNRLRRRPQGRHGRHDTPGVELPLLRREPTQF